MQLYDLAYLVTVLVIVLLDSIIQSSRILAACSRLYVPVLDTKYRTLAARLRVFISTFQID